MNGVNRYADQEQLSTQLDPLSQSHQVETVAQGIGYRYEVIPHGYQKLVEPELKNHRLFWQHTNDR